MAAKKKTSRGGSVGSAARRGDWFIPAIGRSRFKSFDAAARAAGDINRHQGKAFLVKVVEEPSRSRPGAHAYQIYIKATPAYLKILRENGRRHSSARRSSKRRVSKNRRRTSRR